MTAQRPPNLRPVERRLDRYLFVRKRAGDEKVLLLSEARTRLRQVVWLLERVHRLEDRYARLLALQHRELPEPESRRSRRSSRMMAITDELWLMTEAFYYFAARLRAVLRRRSEFRQFEVPGIRNVRNHLVEHADKKGGVMSRSFRFQAGARGPSLKPFGGASGSTRDAGLYVNALELQRALERALAKVGGVGVDTAMAIAYKDY